MIAVCKEVQSNDQSQDVKAAMRKKFKRTVFCYLRTYLIKEDRYQNFSLEKIRHKKILKKSASLNSFNQSGYFEFKNKTDIYKNNNKAIILQVKPVFVMKFGNKATIACIVTTIMNTSDL